MLLLLHLELNLNGGQQVGLRFVHQVSGMTMLTDLMIIMMGVICLGRIIKFEYEWFKSGE